MDCSLPGSSIHGIFQARVLERVTSAFSENQGQGSLMSLLNLRGHMGSACLGRSTWGVNSWHLDMCIQHQTPRCPDVKTGLAFRPDGDKVSGKRLAGQIARVRGLGHVSRFPRWSQSRTHHNQTCIRYMQVQFQAERWNLGQLRENCRRFERKLTCYDHISLMELSNYVVLNIYLSNQMLKSLEKFKHG